MMNNSAKTLLICATFFSYACAAETTEPAGSGNQTELESSTRDPLPSSDSFTSGPSDSFTSGPSDSDASTSTLAPCDGSDCDASCAGQSEPQEECPQGWGCYEEEWVCLDAGESCPEPQAYEGVCTTAIAWAVHPETDLCCEYADSCSAPAGWQVSLTGCDGE
ncbi:MAG: hypothetical protein MK135_04835 [Polyangiaceae bacterium]|nr:hypothetical protein [Polyangiaceae bacterium]